MSSSVALDNFQNTPVLEALRRAKCEGRFPHALLVHGDDEASLWKICTEITALWLSPPVEKHPDCYILRPTKKMRFIHVDEMRGLTQNIQKSPAVADHKVAIVWDADRLHLAAANAFLKTLEEPPADTTLILTTTRPYAILPTIRSRCLFFRVAGASAIVGHPEWQEWLQDYQGWLEELFAPQIRSAHVMMGLYGLLSRFEHCLEKWAEAPVEPPYPMSDEELEAEQAGAQNKLRRLLCRDIEAQTVHYFQAQSQVLPSAWSRTLLRLERLYGLMEVNLNPTTALECYFLSLLRLRAVAA